MNLFLLIACTLFPILVLAVSEFWDRVMVPRYLATRYPRK